MMPTMQSIARDVAEFVHDAQPWLSAIVGIAIVIYLLRRLLCCGGQYTRSERFAMSLIAAGMVLATPALWLSSTPFGTWSFNIARIGIALYIVTGGLRRDRHRHRNLQQQAYAEGFSDGRSANGHPVSAGRKSS
jgi:hypothetical protein